MVLHGMVLYCIVWYCRILHGIAWYCIVFYCAPFTRLEPALCALFGHRPSNFATFGEAFGGAFGGASMGFNPMMQMQGIPRFMQENLFSPLDEWPAVKVKSIAQR